MKNRQKELKKNFRRMFWIKAFSNVRFISIVASLFYLHRGLLLSQIYYLAIFFAIGSFLFEVPSSYLADHWGRKKTIILGILLTIIYFSIFLFSQNFFWFVIAAIMYGAADACMTGTDEALVYDTEEELKNSKKTLGKLGKFQSSRRLFKIVSAIAGAYIAKDLFAWQFNLLISIDILALIIALLFAIKIIEPRHKMDVEKQEAGVMIDAINLFKKDKMLFKVMLNRELIFFSFFILWTFYQKFFVDLGVSVLSIGVLWGIGHLITATGLWFTEKVKGNVEEKINHLNLYYLLVVFLYLLFIFFHFNPILLFIMFILMSMISDLRYPFFSEFFNKKFHSYNRATTISLSNILHSLLEVPILLLAGLLIDKSMIYPFYLSLFIAMMVVIFLKIPYNKTSK